MLADGDKLQTEIFSLKSCTQTQHASEINARADSIHMLFFKIYFAYSNQDFQCLQQQNKLEATAEVNGSANSFLQPTALLLCWQ